jgi:hypothetical protein
LSTKELEYISIQKSGNCTKHANRLKDSAMVTTVGFFPSLLLSTPDFVSTSITSARSTSRGRVVKCIAFTSDRADDNDDNVLVNLADDLDNLDDKASAHIDGMSEDDNVEEVDANAAQNDDVDNDNSDAAQKNMDDEGDANAGKDNGGQDGNVNAGPGEGVGNNDDDQDKHHDDQGAGCQ